MGLIEWDETQEYKPEIKSLEEFVINNRINFEFIKPTNDFYVFIEQSALEGLYDFLAHDTNREHGGVLIGKPYFDEEVENYFVDIRVAIPAQETEGTPIHLQFTSDAWSFISGVIEENYPDLVVVGWYHSHPGLGVFMSSTDRETQKAFFNHPWSLATVVDPIAKITGWFFDEKCHKLDRTQVISYVRPKDKEYYKESRESYNLEKLNWLLPFLGFFIVAGLLGFFLFKLKKI